MATTGVEAVGAFEAVLREMLQRAAKTKQTTTIEPPLARDPFNDLLKRIDAIPSIEEQENEKKKLFRNGVIETVARDTLYELLSSSNIDEPSFVQVWNLLDIASMLSDTHRSDPILLFWLVEELLDSQTILGCRKVFDYLDSRRERITAQDFHKKSAPILRMCNELLRRLSRAEDTAFCGRVFIFMFHCFPLGDKSAVNSRGEYHTENVTMFDETVGATDTAEKMEIDSEGATPAAANGTPKADDPKVAGKTVSFDSKKPNGETKPMDSDSLYPIFWSLQQSFSQPKKLFDAAHFNNFKRGLEATVVKFKSVPSEPRNSTPTKNADEKRTTKRKRSVSEDDLANTFNPKYLTSRDLFDLEISDLSFRRHVLVQALIIMDFLLSLSPKAKAKLAGIEKPNKALIYEDQILSEEDTQWALNMKASITEYLRQGSDGMFFFRMVETVLSRDKNWARWKIESCPKIEMPAVDSDLHVKASLKIKKETAKKIMRDQGINLDFLKNSDGKVGLERLKKRPRFDIPPVEEFESKIEEDDEKLVKAKEAKDHEAEKMLIEAKYSKSWRALRIGSRNKLSVFDKIEDATNIGAIFKEVEVESPKVESPKVENERESEEVLFPIDRRPVVISGPSGVGKGTLVEMLLEKHPKVFGKKVSHTTREPREGEENGVHYHFVDKEQFDALVQSGDFVETNNFDNSDYATSRKEIESIIASGKVPLMELDMNGIIQTKENSFAARYIFIAPPSIEELESRLRARDTESPKKMEVRLKIARHEIEKSKEEGFHDKIVVNNDLMRSYEELESYIFGTQQAAQDAETAEAADAEMKDEALPAKEATDVPMTDVTPAVDGHAKVEPKVEEKLSKIGVVDLSH